MYIIIDLGETKKIKNRRQYKHEDIKDCKEIKQIRGDEV